MKKIAFILGGLVGYVLGARAGRERYDQIRDMGQRAWEDPRVQQNVQKVETTIREQTPVLREKAGAVAGDVADKAKHAADDAATKAKGRVEGIKEARATKDRSEEGKGQYSTIDHLPEPPKQ